MKIELDKSSSTLSNLGYSYFAQNDFDNALKTFRESLDIERDSSSAFCGLVKSFLKKGLIQDAHEYFRTLSINYKKNILS